MKTASGALVTLLNSGVEFFMADLYTLTLKNGTVTRYTSFDVDLTWNSNTWLSGGPVIDRGNTRTVIGLEVDTLSLKISPKDTDLIGTQSWFAAAAAGVLDGAQIKLDRAFIETLPTVAGVLNMFTGAIGQLTLDRMMLDITCNSMVELLNIKLPRNLYQAGCQHTLFDAGCALSAAAFAVSGNVSGSATRTSFATSLAAEDGYYDLGAIQFASGALAGTKRTVKSWAGGVITPLNPLPVAPAASDTFTIWPGCDRTKATCESAKFNNVVNFKGFPFIPVPETSF
jgi:uncharacterized phage protein (TIGR02218 family)